MMGATMAVRRVLLLGAGDLTDETAEALAAADAEVRRLEDPDVDSLREALAAGADAVAVVSRDDAWPLRAALLVRHLDADVPIVATIFDPIAGRELEQQIGNCTITSLADIVAPVLAGPCLGDELAAVLDGDGPPRAALGRGRRRDGRRCRPSAPAACARPPPRSLQPFDRSAGLVFFGAIGLALILVAETVSAAIVLEQIAGRRVLRRGQDARHRRPEPRRPGRARSGTRSRLDLDARRARCSRPRSPAGSSSG